LAEKNKNNDEDVEEDNNKQPNKQNNGRELLLPPMDYPDTVEAVFKYGSGGRFTHWGPFAKYVYKNIHAVCIPFDNHHAYSRNNSLNIFTYYYDVYLLLTGNCIVDFEE